MQIVAVILAIALIFKDVTIIGDKYLMRGFAQLLCVLVAFWVPLNLRLSMIARYSLIFAYLAFLFVTNLSETMVVLQLISLAGVIFFFIAFAQTQTPKVQDRFLNVVLWTWFAVCSLSLVSIFVFPATVVYDFGATLSGEGRFFRGLFSKPAMLGSAAGLMVGIAVFKNHGIVVRSVVIAIGLLCLAKTGSRTFWVALLVAMSSTLWLYQPKYRVALLTSIGLFSAIVFLWLSGMISGGEVIQRALRMESAGHMSGRTFIWEAAFEAIRNSPYVGFGYTKGAEGLLSLGPRLWDYLPNMRRLPRETIANFSLHNGYMQAMMDSGYIGLTLYVLTILGALTKVVIDDRERAYPLVFFGLLFSMITNLAETTMYSAAVFHSVLFWYFCVHAYAMRHEPTIARVPLNANR
jgi:O-antigen ligase